jgi:hypothetical protein
MRLPGRPAQTLSHVHLDVRGEKSQTASRVVRGGVMATDLLQPLLYSWLILVMVWRIEDVRSRGEGQLSQMDY